MGEKGGAITPGGVAGEHPVVEAQPVLVSPATAQQFNTIRPVLIPFACWRLDDIRFEFDSSFVLPAAAEELPELKRLIDQHERLGSPPPLSVFGHADPIGDDDYNKQLSGRRAQAIYALLVRDTELWEDLYASPLGGDDWSRTSIGTMLEALGHAPAPERRAAVESFQAEQGLAQDGIAGPITRERLFRLYMDAICRDAEGRPYVVAKSDFLAGGEDAAGKGDYQGCSEFNPILLFSAAEEEDFSKPAAKATRNAENAPNRRVVVFLYHVGAHVDPRRWPCPRVKEGVSDCRKRFWSDGEERRSRRLPEKRRRFEDEQDTLACRFYHRMASNSPCEQIRFLVLIRVYDQDGKFIAGAPFRSSVDGGPSVEGRADDGGIVGVPASESSKRCLLEWGFAPESAGDASKQGSDPGDFGVEGEPPLPFRAEIFLQVDEAAPGEEEEARRKLNNLGYDEALSLAESVAGFQEEYGHLASPPLAVTGLLDARTLELIREVHRECADDLRQSQPS